MSQETDKIDPFVVPVNEHGYPKNFVMKPRQSDSNLKWLPPLELTRYYWLLKCLRVTYLFTYRGITHKRTLDLMTNVKGVQRAETVPLFIAEGRDDNAEWIAFLDFSDVSRAKDPKKLEQGVSMPETFALKLFVEEQGKDYVLSTEAAVGDMKCTSSKDATLFKRNWTLYGYGEDILVEHISTGESYVVLSSNKLREEDLPTDGDLPVDN